jgi:hypothetical protein
VSNVAKQREKIIWYSIAPVHSFSNGRFTKEDFFHFYDLKIVSTNGHLLYKDFGGRLKEETFAISNEFGQFIAKTNLSTMFYRDNPANGIVVKSAYFVTTNDLLIANFEITGGQPSQTWVFRSGKWVKKNSFGDWWLR